MKEKDKDEESEKSFNKTASTYAQIVGSPLKYMRFWDTLVGGDGTWGVGNEKTINEKSSFLTKKSRNVFKIG